MTMDGISAEAGTRRVLRRAARRAARAAACLVLALGMLAPAGGGAPAAAATVNINSVSGTWISVEGGDKVAGEGSNHLSWGGLSKSRRSDYIFDGRAPQSRALDVPGSTAFDLGTFTHRNYRIPSGSGIKAAALEVSFDVSIDDTPMVLSPLVFSFDHWETPNRDSPCADGGTRGSGVNANGCADRLTILSNPGGNASLTLKGMTYLFSVTGFTLDGSTPLSEWWTREKADNVAVLRGEVTAVPLPAAGLLLLGGLGGLGLLAARRRAG